MEINRAPVLTLWATVVAQNLGYSEDEALTLGKAVAGYTAQYKGRTLGIYKERKKEKFEEGGEATIEVDFIELMGRSIPVIEDKGQVRAISKDKAIKPDSVRTYLNKKFGGNLEEVTAVMEELAGSFMPSDLNQIAFKLYEKFRPEIPKGKRGWGAKGELDLGRIKDLKKG
jgi:hypothetical protein